MEIIFRHNYQGPVKAVILDWAGTAVDYGSFAPTAVFLRLFESQGVAISAEDARSGMGLMKKDHLKTIFNRPGVAHAWQEEHGEPVSQSDIDMLFKDFIPMQIAVLQDYADPISGLVNVLKELRENKIKIGSTTGYTRVMMDVLAPVAEKRGFSPDSIVCPDEVPAGRPYPWMCYQNAIKMDVFPMQAMVKVGDTIIDMEEGANAGMWTVGLSLTGNLLGKTESEVKAMSENELDEARKRIEPQLFQAGAHYVVDGIWDLPLVIKDIESRLKNGDKP